MVSPIRSTTLLVTFFDAFDAYYSTEWIYTPLNVGDFAVKPLVRPARGGEVLIISNWIARTGQTPPNVQEYFLFPMFFSSLLSC